MSIRCCFACLYSVISLFGRCVGCFVVVLMCWCQYGVPVVSVFPVCCPFGVSVCDDVCSWCCFLSLLCLSFCFLLLFVFRPCSPLLVCTVVIVCCCCCVVLLLFSVPAPCSRFQVPDSRFPIPGSGFLVKSRKEFLNRPEESSTVGRAMWFRYCEAIQMTPTQDPKQGSIH